VDAKDATGQAGKRCELAQDELVEIVTRDKQYDIWIIDVMSMKSIYIG
jgi:hypothetical protein